MEHALAIPTLDDADPRLGHPFDEIADRHHPGIGGNADPVKLADAALITGVADLDVDLVITVIGTVFANLQPIGNQTDGVADTSHIDTELGRLWPVDIQFPFNSGHRAAVLDINEAWHGFHLVADTLQDRLDDIGRQAAEFDINRLALARTALFLAKLDIDAGKIGSLFPQIGQNCTGGVTVAPELELKGQLANDVFAIVLPTVAAGAGIDGFQPVMAEHTILDLTHQGIFLPDREITPGMYQNDRILWFHIGEELDTLTKGAIGHDRTNQHHH